MNSTGQYLWIFGPNDFPKYVFKKKQTLEALDIITKLQKSLKIHFKRPIVDTTDPIRTEPIQGIGSVINNYAIEIKFYLSEEAKHIIHIMLCGKGNLFW